MSLCTGTVRITSTNPGSQAACLLITMLCPARCMLHFSAHCSFQSTTHRAAEKKICEGRSANGNERPRAGRLENRADDNYACLLPQLAHSEQHAVRANPSRAFNISQFVGITWSLCPCVHGKPANVRVRALVWGSRLHYTCTAWVRLSQGVARCDVIATHDARAARCYVMVLPLDLCGDLNTPGT